MNTIKIDSTRDGCRRGIWCNMNFSVTTFLSPGTDLMKTFAGIAIMLLFVAGTAAAMGWITATVDNSILMKQDKLATSYTQDE